jgi:ketosteroid isomerase-like protein
MADHPNIALFGRIYEAFTSGDMATLRTLFSSDVVWHTPGHNLISGDYRGIDATLGSFMEELSLAEGTYEVEVHSALADDRHIVALLRCTARRLGRTLDMNYIIVFHVSDAQITEAWEFWSDQAELDAFWA